MEFEDNLMFNFISIFATILLAFVTCTIVFQKLKSRWPIKVNCWFCNNNTKIRRQELEWWLCPSCEQFNGFSENGDYTYDVPERYKVPGDDSVRYCRSETKTEGFPKSTFCKECDKRQRVKLVELSNFEPENEKKYESEVERFKSTLERKYPLCANCNTIVQNVLAKQAMWLAHYKMLFFKQKPIRKFLNNAKRFEVIFRIVSTIFDSVTVYNTEFLLLPVGGLFFQLCAGWASAAKRRNSDILLAFLWICIIILIPFKEYKLLRTNLENDWFSLEYITQYHTVIFFAFIIGFMNIKPRSSIKSKKDILFKRMEVHRRNSRAEKSVEMEVNLVKATKRLTTPIPVDTPDTIGTTILAQLSTPSMGESEVSKLSTATSTVDIRTNLSLKNNQLDNSGLDDSMSTLSIFSLGDNLANGSVRTPKVFEKKIYSTISSDLFKKSGNAFGKKYILSPPKLRSVTQTSWVAGGYWQEGMDAPSLSRSSSQSSGFGSLGSNCAPSREPSVHEFDQCSIISDASLPYYSHKQSSIKSIRRFCQPAQSCSFVKPKSPMCHQTLKFSQSHLFPQQTLAAPHFPKNTAILDECCAQHSKICTDEIGNSMNMQTYPAYATIATNHIWLHALLCGSLILNMIVVCTTLLR